MEICLVRHGETDWNKEGRLQGRMNIPLNQAGVDQANECANHLSTTNYDLIITSPLLRAKQTAEIISEKMSVPILEMNHFIERNYGDAEGLTVVERTSKFPNRNYPNQEPRDSLTKRVMEALHFIYQSEKDKRIILVSHGGVINAILAAISNNEIGSGKTKLGNACLSEIKFEKDKWTIQYYNQTSHLSTMT
ncbi:histidine phosphatase family protein [Lysinibacillus sp. fls2-241-R2A-57]|uniref:histidine phosphatase family protein n=1 Tax=Lysinibacillus sp. fls2-241-R2A-57 TaxID=3040292 RepID=UPI00255409F9|nr:histidine phosphatase family protein [Lysinibacillus sp. fls2-241-R2A-57]